MTLRRALVLVLGWSAVAGLLAPVAFAVWVSFSPDSFLTPPAGQWSLRWYRAFATDARWSAAVGRSLFTAVLSAGVAVTAGTPLALALARYRFLGRGALSAAVILPACIPGAVLGMGLLPLFHVARLTGTPLGLVLAHGLLGLPVVVLIARDHLTRTSPDLEAAARGLGANGWQTTVRITLPLLRPAILAGAAAALAISLNESLVTVFLATPDTETLPTVAWSQLRYAPSPLVAVASSFGALAAVLIALVVARLVRPRPQ